MCLDDKNYERQTKSYLQYLPSGLLRKKYEILDNRCSNFWSPDEIFICKGIFVSSFLSFPFNSFPNTMGKGEIARNERFLLFPQCFQKACTADT